MERNMKYMKDQKHEIDLGKKGKKRNKRSAFKTLAVAAVVLVSTIAVGILGTGCTKAKITARDNKGNITKKTVLTSSDLFESWAKEEAHQLPGDTVWVAVASKKDTIKRMFVKEKKDAEPDTASTHEQDTSKSDTSGLDAGDSDLDTMENIPEEKGIEAEIEYTDNNGNIVKNHRRINLPSNSLFADGQDMNILRTMSGDTVKIKITTANDTIKTIYLKQDPDSLLELPDMEYEVTFKDNLGNVGKLEKVPEQRLYELWNEGGGLGDMIFSMPGDTIWVTATSVTDTVKRMYINEPEEERYIKKDYSNPQK